MLYKECGNCGEHFDDMGNDYIGKCPECGSEDYTEIYDIVCNDCGYEFEGMENDECPNCNSCDTVESE